MRNWFFASLVAAIVGGAAFFFAPNNYVSEVKQPPVVSSPLPKVESVAAASASQSVAQCVNSRPPLLAPETKIHATVAFDEKVKASYRAGLQDQATLLKAAAAGESASAVAMFTLLTLCPPFDTVIGFANGIPEGVSAPDAATCTALRASTDKNPLLGLQAAIRRGSPEAKLVFAKHATQIVKIQEICKSTAPGTDKEQILQDAKQYGEDTARSGLEQAFTFMAYAHQTGMFGKPDLMQSYAYTLALSLSNKSAELSERLDFLDKQLTKPQIDDARSYALGCQAANKL